jgi:hypothetical protein
MESTALQTTSQDTGALTKADPATAALSAQATASIQARYVMAQRNPRSWDQVRIRSLASCKRPAFAEAAIYAKPVGGGKIRGPSARLAEELFRNAGNISDESQTVYEDTHKRVIRVTITDFETNAVRSSDVTVEKTIERKNAKDRQIVSQRTNTAGDIVYVVACTDDELLTKTNALVSKARRNLTLISIPADIVDDCMAMCISTARGEVKDLSEQRKKLCDAFSSVGVTPRDLEEYLGHSLDSMHPDEVIELREIFAAVRDGDTKWTEALASKLGVEASDRSTAKEAPKSKLADKIRQKSGIADPAQPEAQEVAQ